MISLLPHPTAGGVNAIRHSKQKMQFLIEELTQQKGKLLTEQVPDQNKDMNQKNESRQDKVTR